MKYLRIAVLALGLVLIAGSAFFLIKNHARAAEARAWPRAHARIVASEVRILHAQEVGNEGDFLPYVRYAYTVNGRTLHGETIWLDERRSFGSANVAARELAFLETGSETEVMYNPANPSEAALNVEENAWPKIFMLLSGLLLAGFGWWWRPPAKAAAPAGMMPGMPPGMAGMMPGMPGAVPGMQPGMPGVIPGMQLSQAGPGAGPAGALPSPPSAPDATTAS
ncbi:MAG TPA: DUF3592 domain-containing protein [Allosphingosinicella sp.]|nr:DUF3592 domain-containing protein [Allosphingosinicella sp.]